MVLRFHEIAEAEHRILNPFTVDKLRLLADVCRLKDGQRLLDLCCGKGEMLSTWSRDHGISGVGVDLSEVFLAAARQRAAQLGVDDHVRFIHRDASTYRDSAAPYDLVSCIGATWIGGGLGGTIDLIRPMVREGGLVLIGERYWITEPTSEAEDVLGHGFTSLVGTLDRCAERGAALVEMVLRIRIAGIAMWPHSGGPSHNGSTTMLTTQITWECRNSWSAGAGATWSTADNSSAGECSC
jgi:SAM-dependent methyltransferase